MFCNKCGTSLPEESAFCTNCGNNLAALSSPAPAGQAAAPVERAATPVQQAAPSSETGSKTGGGFFKSGAGIALVIILAVAVAAGITFGIIFLVKSGANGEVDAATVKVWDEYESLLEEQSEDIPPITLDQGALAKTQEDLKKTQEKVAALEKALKETGGSEARRKSNVKVTSVRDVKADELAAALAAYNQFVQKMNELFTTLVGANLLDQNVVNKLNEILAELKKLGGKVTVTSNTFLKDNSKVVTVKIDPPILKFAADAAPKIQETVTAAQVAEQKRLEAEKAAAEAAAAEAERQRQEQEAAQQPTMVRVARVSNPCGDPTCEICYMWVEQ